MLRAVLVFALGATAPVLAQESHSGLNGTLESGIYTSATNTFKIPVPVLPELGARISDTDNVVIFKDGFDVLQITIGAFPQDATQRWELSTRGTKDYLIYFIGTIVLEDFKRFCPETTIESARYASRLPGRRAFRLHPPARRLDVRRPAAGLRRSAQASGGEAWQPLFVKNGYVFVISTELVRAGHRGFPLQQDRPGGGPDPAQAPASTSSRRCQFTKPAAQGRPPVADRMISSSSSLPGHRRPRRLVRGPHHEGQRLRRRGEYRRRDRRRRSSAASAFGCSASWPSGFIGSLRLRRRSAPSSLSGSSA